MAHSSRHGRQPTFSKPIATVFWLVALGVVAVALLAEQRLAMQLAIAGALSASFMIWSVYDSALREARSDYAHERTLHSRSVGAAAEQARANEREIAALRAQVERLERELAEATTGDLWSDLSEAPTIVDMANRREARPIAIVKDAAETA
jgi:choline-glycine betaine transporter